MIGEYLTWQKMSIIFVVLFLIQFITRTKAVADGMMFRQIMIDSQVDAIMYARGLDKNFDWLMFDYKGLNKGVYTWELVPTGAYKSYQYGMIISEFALATVIGMVLLHYLLK